MTVLSVLLHTKVLIHLSQGYKGAKNLKILELFL